MASTMPLSQGSYRLTSFDSLSFTGKDSVYIPKVGGDILREQNQLPTESPTSPDIKSKHEVQHGNRKYTCLLILIHLG